MKNSHQLTFLGLLFILLSFNATAQSNAFDNDVRKFLKITKAQESIQQMIPMIIQQFKSLRPDIPNSAWTAMKKEVKKEMGYGMVINTSFNVRGEPIVQSPYDAYRCFMETNMDVLAIGDFILLKEDQPNWIKPKKQFNLD